MMALFSKSRVEINQPAGPEKDLQTCLHIAVEIHHIEMVKWLLEYTGAKAVQLKDAGGRTAWDKACYFFEWSKKLIRHEKSQNYECLRLHGSKDGIRPITHGLGRKGGLR
jgi:hypothetical protein